MRSAARPLPLLVLVPLLPLLAACGRDAADTIEGTGTLEIVEVEVAPTTPGRVVRVLREEGAAIRVGDTLAVLTQPTLAADVEGRRARLASAEAQLRDLEAGARPSEIARAEAELRSVEADAERAQRDLARATPLVEAQAISRQQYDAVRAAATAAAARRDAVRDQLRLVREGARPERVSAARAEVTAARAAVAAAMGTAGDLVLTAPVTGVVVRRNVEPGEIAAAGQGVLTVADPTRPFIRIYVNQHAFPRVKVGAPATVTLDAFPDRPFAGRVAAVATAAEFTPRVALTEDEREDLLFAVKVELTDTTGMLKAGLPATVRVTPAPAP